ncbi:hypothetical protein GCM10009682_59980 [Luedemannella flava]|uniref:Uncharacterized protein n=1 Tax=Luedemannella flava TaxID=349316 RepID=A0ABP4YX69_9ACTN
MGQQKTARRGSRGGGRDSEELSAPPVGGEVVQTSEQLLCHRNLPHIDRCAHNGRQQADPGQPNKRTALDGLVIGQ